MAKSESTSEANHLHFQTSDSEVMGNVNRNAESKKQHRMNDIGSFDEYQTDISNSNGHGHFKDDDALFSEFYKLSSVTLTTPRIRQILKGLMDVESQLNQGVDLLCAERRVDSWKKDLTVLLSRMNASNQVNTEMQKVIAYLLHMVTHIASDIKRKLENEFDLGLDNYTRDRVGMDISRTEREVNPLHSQKNTGKRDQGCEWTWRHVVAHCFMSLVFDSWFIFLAFNIMKPFL